MDAGTVGIVEAHGTGTPVGDPIEFGSLSQVYGTAGKPCALGSAKSNLGHTESAAGAVGLIKAVLALQHGVVPPVLHFTALPDDLRRIDTGLFVPQAVTPWPTRNDETPRRAAVSSYGMSGTNVHAVLEQAPETATRTTHHQPGRPLLYRSRPPRPRNCATPPGGWPSGRATTPMMWRHPTSLTPWRAGVPTARCARPWSPRT